MSKWYWMVFFRELPYAKRMDEFVHGDNGHDAWVCVYAANESQAIRKAKEILGRQ